jgi:hypothetical protein
MGHELQQKKNGLDYAGKGWVSLDCAGQRTQNPLIPNMMMSQPKFEVDPRFAKREDCTLDEYIATKQAQMARSNTLETAMEVLLPLVRLWFENDLPGGSRVPWDLPVPEFAQKMAKNAPWGRCILVMFPSWEHMIHSVRHIIKHAHRTAELFQDFNAAADTEPGADIFVQHDSDWIQWLEYVHVVDPRMVMSTLNLTTDDLPKDASVIMCVGYWQRSVPTDVPPLLPAGFMGSDALTQIDDVDDLNQLSTRTMIMSPERYDKYTCPQLWLTNHANKATPFTLMSLMAICTVQTLVGVMFDTIARPTSHLFPTSEGRGTSQSRIGSRPNTAYVDEFIAMNAVYCMRCGALSRELCDDDNDDDDPSGKHANHKQTKHEAGPWCGDCDCVFFCNKSCQIAAITGLPGGGCHDAARCATMTTLRKLFAPSEVDEAKVTGVVRRIDAAPLRLLQRGMFTDGLHSNLIMIVDPTGPVAATELVFAVPGFFDETLVRRMVKAQLLNAKRSTVPFARLNVAQPLTSAQWHAVLVGVRAGDHVVISTLGKTIVASPARAPPRAAVAAMDDRSYRTELPPVRLQDLYDQVWFAAFSVMSRRSNSTDVGTSDQSRPPAAIRRPPATLARDLEPKSSAAFTVRKAPMSSTTCRDAVVKTVTVTQRASGGSAVIGSHWFRAIEGQASTHPVIWKWTLRMQNVRD